MQYFDGLPLEIWSYRKILDTNPFLTSRPIFLDRFQAILSDSRKSEILVSGWVGSVAGWVGGGGYARVGIARTTRQSTLLDNLSYQTFLVTRQSHLLDNLIYQTIYLTRQSQLLDLLSYQTILVTILSNLLDNLIYQTI